MSKLIERDGKLFVEVGPNDSLGSIAFEHAGRSDRWRELLRCNKDLDPNLPAIPGSTLELPESWSAETLVLEPEIALPIATMAMAQALKPIAQSVAGGGDSPHILEDVVRKVLAEWASHADEVIEGLKDKVALLEMKRDQDEKRLAEQGGKLITLEAQLKELAGKANTAPPTPPPAPVPPEHAEGI